MSCCGETKINSGFKTTAITLAQLQDVREPICRRCVNYKQNDMGESFCEYIPKPYDEESCPVGYILRYQQTNLDYLWTIPHAACPNNKWYIIVEDKIIEEMKNAVAKYAR